MAVRQAGCYRVHTRARRPPVVSPPAVLPRSTTTDALTPPRFTFARPQDSATARVQGLAAASFAPQPAAHTQQVAAPMVQAMAPMQPMAPMQQAAMYGQAPAGFVPCAALAPAAMYAAGGDMGGRVDGAAMKGCFSDMDLAGLQVR